MAALKIEERCTFHRDGQWCGRVEADETNHVWPTERMRHGAHIWRNDTRDRLGLATSLGLTEAPRMTSTDQLEAEQAGKPIPYMPSDPQAVLARDIAAIRARHEPPNDYVAGECVWCMTDFGHAEGCPLPDLLLMARALAESEERVRMLELGLLWLANETAGHCAAADSPDSLLDAERNARRLLRTRAALSEPETPR